jgi:hypothetical protein
MHVVMLSAADSYQAGVIVMTFERIRVMLLPAP